MLDQTVKSTLGVSSYIHYLSPCLSRREYDYWMDVSEVVILPYNAESYRKRSSGIFIESIIAGKAVFVTKGTWMASELEKFQLNELVVNWDTSSPMKKIYDVFLSGVFWERLTKMQGHYTKFHSFEGMRQTLLIYAEQSNRKDMNFSKLTDAGL